MVAGEVPDGHRVMPNGSSAAPANMTAPPFTKKDGERSSHFVPEVHLGLVSTLAAAVVALLLYWAALVPGIAAMYYILANISAEAVREACARVASCYAHMLPCCELCRPSAGCLALIAGTGPGIELDW